MRTRERRIDAPKHIEIHIGMGLPGSGKTTYLQTIAPKCGVTTVEGVYKTTIDLDSIMMKGRGSGFRYVTIDGKLSFEKLFNYATSLSCWDKKRIICIDSLCLSRETVKEYLNGLYKVSQDRFPCGNIISSSTSGKRTENSALKTTCFVTVRTRHLIRLRTHHTNRSVL